jgi:hypothetical protein
MKGSPDERHKYNKIREHTGTSFLRFDTHRGLCQSEENDCV